MKFTIAVLGAGGWGGNWTERALRDPDCEIRAIADSNPAVLERLAARGIPGDRLFARAEDALDAGHTDMVTCSIPNPHRVPYLVRALEEGRHLLTDKPLVHTAEALRTLLEKGRSRKSVFMIAQNYRHFAGARRVKEILDSGSFGSVAAIHSHFLRSSRHVGASYVKNLSGFAAMGLEMCIHHFDLMRHFLDALPHTVSARAWRTPWSPGVGYDGLDVNLGFSGGATVAYDATWGATYDATDWNGHWEVIAERGTISYGAVKRALRVYDQEGASIESEQGPDASADTTHSMDRVWLLFKKAVADTSRDGAGVLECFCSLEDNAKSLGIALAVENSVETGAPVAYDAFMRRNGLM